MKGYVNTASLLFAAISLTACSSSYGPLEISEADVMKNPSRCGFHETENDPSNIITPISRKDPNYPLAAAMDEVQGYAEMEYDISEDGRPVNINVIEGYPGDTFANAAAAALTGWRFPAQASTCQVVRLDFRLE
ncbi:TonB family protein [Alteromonas sp. H39]|uniref:TonB family protein n=1 Tax=Alteromonas sp. H39 TaxID=3389876 RepID=UPI0039E0F758